MGQTDLAREEGDGSPQRVSWVLRGRHAILSWRLWSSYLFYCVCCFILTVFLLVWTLIKGMQNHWNLPDWKHHQWEEILEVGVSTALVVETLNSVWVCGVVEFFRSCWHILDVVVAVLAMISVGYGLSHLRQPGNIYHASLPLLMLRFVLQPARVLVQAKYTHRIHQMQKVNELPVDFNSLRLGQGAGGAAIELGQIQ
mmetsp:Transcript_16886/g.49387  ORF Transcript_16886/g.49387 Transcript_16886/m.49387 type:complete len:198 (+) Transcript_16886:166-759(+)